MFLSSYYVTEEIDNWFWDFNMLIVCSVDMETVLWIFFNVVLLNPTTTNHLLTDPADHLTHRPNNHRPTEKTMFKKLENMKTLILQNANTAGEMENYYLFE